LMIEKVPVGPTRYRTVVLTSWDRSMSDSVPFFTPAEVGGLLILTHSLAIAPGL
jgi:hypothetical protein